MGKLMLYHDRVYGEIEITEPVLLELMACPAMQRLKGIDTGGHNELFFPGKSHNRFDHCVGVMILLKMYGAGLQEQIAGLLHDASHTAFSHTVDFIFGSSKQQSFQDDRHEAFVNGTEIPNMLKKYSFDPRLILNHNNYPLLETKLPDLCADRIDYAWRWIVGFPELCGRGKKDKQSFFKSLRVSNGKWVVADIEIAKKFVFDFLKLNNEVWSGPKAVVTFYNLSELLKYALAKNHIIKTDLDRDDVHVWRKIEKTLALDTELARLYRIAKTPWNYIPTDVSPDVAVAVKSRAIDPWVGDGSKRYSELDPAYRPILAKALQPLAYSLKLVA